MNVALIGCGKVSLGHAKAWLERDDAKITMLVDVAEDLACAAREDHDLPEDITISTRYEDALESDEIDILDICTPSHLHTEQIIAALQAGKHMVVEKPTGYSLEECRLLRYMRMKYPDPKVAVAYSLRYYPVNVEVKRLLMEGAIGEIISGQFTWNHPHDYSDHQPRYEGRSAPGYGLLSDLGGRYIPSSEASGATHPFDLARHMMGGQAVEVYAHRGRSCTSCIASFEGGASCTIVGGSGPKQGMRNPTVVQVQGKLGTIVTYMDKAGAYTGVIADEEGERAIDASPEAGHGDTKRTENILNAIRHDEPLIASLEDSITTSEFLHAIWDSYEHGIRIPVHTAHKTG
ncbi:MAG: Gfo/Idh/MocA family oxidoreductase [candidate division WS1 bacterium]|nr:Gfo/Idh/MocA family oxidoreductase [candidate division WS1 bacterium]